jgi:ribosomal-protein-alanine N-acetyltransferase
VIIRPATLADLAAIIASEADNFGADGWSPALVEEGVAGRLPTVHYLVVEQDGQVVGHAVASVVADIAELQRIAVNADHRRRGLATAMLDEVVALAVRERAERLLLEVRENNQPALDFYAAHGFIEVDRRPRYYGDGSAAVVLRRSLGRGPDQHNGARE